MRFIVALLAAASPLGHAADGNSSLVLDAGVQDQALKLLKDYRPRVRQLKLTEVHEIKSAGNLGKTVQENRQALYAKQDSGLWAITGTGGAADGSGAGVSQTLSLCGLVPLLNVVDSSSKVDMQVTAGKLPPFTIPHSLDVLRRNQVKALRTQNADLCSPAPGASFGYQMENEHQIKAGRRTAGSNVSQDVSCHVGASAAPAATLAPGLRGDYLPVSCEGTMPSGAKNSWKYAYLRDAGLYLLLEEGLRFQTTKVQYKAVEYTD